jgi:serine/threonine protein kinase
MSRQSDIARIHAEVARLPVWARADFLLHACGSDDRLRQDVEALLRTAAAPDLSSPTADAGGAAIDANGSPLIGRTLGAYRIESWLGAGSMGEVYRAVDVRLGRTVAIKILPADLGRDAARRLQFEREARTVAGLRHAHICVLHDVGTSDELDYLVMEYLQGETLAVRLRRGSLPFVDTIRYASELAGALMETHRSGVIHRDLKPTNIMLTPSGAKLLDFGVASLRPADGEETRPPTHHGLVGTLSYMAPEQLGGREADARADIFAFGAILYEMAIGQKAFDGATRAELSVRHVTPRHLRRVIRKCVNLDPGRRFQTVAELLAQLRKLEARVARDGGTNRISNRLVKAAGLLAFIWFVGPLLTLANWRPLDGRTSRLVVMAATAMAIVAWSLWQWHRRYPARRVQLALYGATVGAAITALMLWLNWE